MTTLGIDTAAGVSVGLADAGQVIASVHLEESRSHAERLMPLINDMLTNAGLDWSQLSHVICGMGPGPYTGLRVGVVSAQLIADLAGCPFRGVCTLDGIAAAWSEPPAEFIVATDARRKEVYWARYRDRIRVGEPQVAAPDTLPNLPVTGPAAELCGSEAGGPREMDAGVLALRGITLPDVGTEPLYLRPPDATVPGRPKSAIVKPKLRRKNR